MTPIWARGFGRAVSLCLDPLAACAVSLICACSGGDRRTGTVRGQGRPPLPIVMNLFSLQSLGSLGIAARRSEGRRACDGDRHAYPVARRGPTTGRPLPSAARARCGDEVKAVPSCPPACFLQLPVRIPQIPFGIPAPIHSCRISLRAAAVNAGISNSDIDKIIRTEISLMN